MPNYLIAHCNPDGSGAAQAKVYALSEKSAMDWFTRYFPKRVVTAMGIEGEEES